MDKEINFKLCKIRQVLEVVCQQLQASSLYQCTLISTELWQTEYVYLERLLAVLSFQRSLKTWCIILDFTVPF